jgi:hypothetical protein
MLIDGVEYYQVVFTLPSELSKLALNNRQEIANLLFEASWKGLRKTIHQQQGYDPAAMMVLHTWNQKLDAHWHAHALIPGTGPSLHDNRWKVSTAPKDSGLSDDHYLVDAIALREAFRKFALSRLNRLRNAGKLKLPNDGEHGDLNDDEAWRSFIEKLASKDWVSFIEPLPANSNGPDGLVRYLTRYLTGGPISDSRIVEADHESVTFLAREGKTIGGDQKQVHVTMPTREFVQRWCLHIQPDQLTKSRYFGGWSTNRLAAYLERCAAAMHASDVPLAADATEFNTEELVSRESSWSGEAFARKQLKCPKCQKDTLRETKVIEKPSWRDIFARGSESCPPWYAESLEKDERQFWDGAFGEGYYDWYLETQVEGAKRPAAQPPRSKPIQLPLPGLLTGISYGLEFY